MLTTPDYVWKSRSNQFQNESCDFLPPSLWDFLQSRGIQAADQVQSFVSPSLQSLRSPFLIHQMDRAVDRLIEAFQSQQQVLVYGDFDLDGTSGVALLKSGLEGLGFQNVKYYQPSRLVEGYGVHISAIEQFKEQGVNLVVTVDVGITDVKAVARGNELGVDVIVTDHHKPKEELPQAKALINPNQKDCQSGLGHLCGAGVGFFLILALRQQMKKQGLLVKDFDPKSLLDVFAIATLTDLVPLKEENRVLVKHGLIELARTKRVGLRVLLERLGLWGKELTSSDVSISFAPKLNSLSRMEKGIFPVDIFLEESEEKAQKLIDRVIETNTLRVQVQKQAQEEALSSVSCAEKGFTLICSPKFHKGIVGLVATKLAEKFNAPSFVGAISDSGVITGSSRIPCDGHSVLKALSFSKQALERFGGHDAAAGFQLREDRQELFAKLLTDFFSQQGQLQAPEKTYDAELSLSDLDNYFMKWYQALEPFGKGFEPPVFLLKNLSIRAVYSLKGGHLKFQFSQEPSLPALWFSPPESAKEQSKIAKGSPVDILARPQWNFFNNRKSIQLLIQDLKFR